MAIDKVLRELTGAQYFNGEDAPRLRPNGNLLLHGCTRGKPVHWTGFLFL